MAQLGKYSKSTKDCAMDIAVCFALAGKKKKLRKIIEEHPYILAEESEWFSQYLD